MEQIVCEPAGKEIRLWSTGQTWKLFDLGETSVARYGAPYWMVHRGDFHAALRDAVLRAAPDAIRTGAAATGFTQTDTGITLHLASGERIEGDALIGADGVHSAIRHQMFGAGRAQFTGIMAWRGLIPMQRLPAHLQRLVGANWNGRGGHVVTYPLRRGEILNFVGALERDDWRVESWTEAGTIEECARDFADWHPDIQTMIHAIDTPYKWALLGREPLPRFSVGRATLLGDAAHPTLPFLAQGANMAIEDAMILARCLARRPRHPDRAAPLRGRAPGAHRGDRARLQRQRQALPQPRADAGRDSRRLHRSRMDAGEGPRSIRLAVRLRRADRASLTRTTSPALRGRVEARSAEGEGGARGTTLTQLRFASSALRSRASRAEVKSYGISASNRPSPGNVASIFITRNIAHSAAWLVVITGLPNSRSHSGTNAIVGKFPPGTTSTSISARSICRNASRALSGPSLPIIYASVAPKLCNPSTCSPNFVS